MVSDVDWSLVADVMGVAAFATVATWGLYRRGRWFLKQALVLSRVEPSDQHLEAWFVLNNPGPGFDCIYHLSLDATNPSPGAGLQPWSHAVFVPSDPDDALTLIPPGAIVKKVKMTLVVLDGQTMPSACIASKGPPLPSGAWLAQQRDVVGQLLLIKCPLRVELETAYGKVLLTGTSGIKQPMAEERFNWRTRLKRFAG